MRNIFPILMVALISLVVIAGCNSADQEGTKTASTGAAQPPTIYPDGVRRITVQELQALMSRDEAFIVDVRTEDAYKTGHIKGAKLIPVGETANRVNELPKDKLIVTYCS